MEVNENSRLGRYVTTVYADEEVSAFVPPPLPPIPPVKVGGLLRLLEEANQAVGKLDGLATILPDPNLFIYFYVRKEAVLSSQIEGTQSSLSDLLFYELDGELRVPIEDAQETSQYVAAMNYGLERLRGGFPLSLRLIREIHGVLLAHGRGSTKSPGEFRTSQNWIGGDRPGNAVFVPPPPDHLANCLGNFESFLHLESSDLPVLLQAGIMHVQFETIHPFLDGNGRLGRLLITFLLCATGRLTQPLLYLSLYLKTHRDTYYDLLTKVRRDGDWETWCEFFLRGVRDTAQQAEQTAQRILALFAQDAGKIQQTGRISATALRIHQCMQRNPVASIASLAEKTGLSYPTIGGAVDRLVELGLLREVTGKKRGRLFMYTNYLDILQEGTEPLPR